jgi:hypothetical protein
LNAVCSCRATHLLVGSVAALALAGCPSASAGNTEYCNAATNWAQRCGAPQCEIDYVHAHCGEFTSIYRSDVLSNFAHCFDSLQCNDADAGAAIGQCFLGALSGVAPTSAQQRAAQALCNACPEIAGGPMSTPDTCNANFFVRNDAGYSTSFFVVELSDNAADQFATCVQNTTGADGGTRCSAIYSTCYQSLEPQAFMEIRMCLDAGH